MVGDAPGYGGETAIDSMGIMVVNKSFCGREDEQAGRCS